ncbi:MAG TPA: PQQ-binding-like beta-propeller repeat protein [Candidatus Sumerlaeota bacterium]|nr:PQQ-binding-like beta-propeller repeat protein [Candidatus Sumerlaeota bacterium]
MDKSRTIALFLVVVFGVMFQIFVWLLGAAYFRDTSAGLLTTQSFPKKRMEVVKLADDKSQAAKFATAQKQLREEDQELRRAYFANRRKFAWAAGMMVLMGIGLVASARWYESLSAKPTPSVLDPEVRARQEKSWGQARRTGILTVGIVSGVGLATLAALWILIPSHLDREKEDGKSKIPSVPGDKLFKQNWTEFRGEGNLGLAAEGDWPTTWSLPVAPTEKAAAATPTPGTSATATVAAATPPPSQNIVWQTPVSLKGKSSPVVWGGRIFLTGGTSESLSVACYDRLSGSLLWDSKVDLAVTLPEDFQIYEDMAGYAASTPATDGERVYAIFATGVVAAFDYAGTQVWARHLGAPESTYGYSTSLLLHEKTLIVQFDQGSDPEEKKSKLIGLNTATGEDLWNTPRPVKNAWASPSLINTGTRVEVITSAPPFVMAYDPATGQEYWRCDGMSGDVAPSPTFAGGIVFVSNAGAQLMAIKPGGTGDLTNNKEFLLWTGTDGLPDTSSPVSDGTFFLQVAGDGLTCLDVKTGKKLWEKTLKSATSSSPILAGGRVYLSCDNGATYVFTLNATGYKQVGLGDVGEKILATPAFADNQIYIRTVKSLVAVGMPVEGAAAPAQK